MCVQHVQHVPQHRCVMWVGGCEGMCNVCVHVFVLTSTVYISPPTYTYMDSTYAHPDTYRSPTGASLSGSTLFPIYHFDEGSLTGVNPSGVPTEPMYSLCMTDVGLMRGDVGVGVMSGDMDSINKHHISSSKHTTPTPIITTPHTHHIPCYHHRRHSPTAHVYHAVS